MVIYHGTIRKQSPKKTNPDKLPWDLEGLKQWMFSQNFVIFFETRPKYLISFSMMSSKGTV